MAVIEQVRYEDAKQLCGEPIAEARSMAQADVYPLTWRGRPALLKDFSRRPWLMRRFWAPAIVGREVRALVRLEGMKGVPELYAQAGPLAFVMEYLDADRLPRPNDPPPPAAFWDQCRELIDAFHARGLAHGDLRRKNILIGHNDRKPYLIDFATASRRRSGGLDAAISNFLYRRVRQIDQITYARLKQEYAPDLMREDELEWLANIPLHLRLGRFFKQHIYKLTRPRRYLERRRKRARHQRKARKAAERAAKSD